jgi:excisionase family DNA binding protein
MSSDPVATKATDRTLHLVTVAGTSPGSDQLADLPPVIDLIEAAALLGIGRTTAYKLVRRGEWPTPVLRTGRLIKVPTVPLLELLCRSTTSV